MIDLDDIKARLAAVHAAGASGITVRLEHGIRVIVQMQSWEGNTAHEASAAVTHLLGHAPADLTALVAEVERLRLDRADIDHAYAFARNKAMMLEREAVVAWLRGQQEAAEWALTAAGYEHAADAIERGEYRREVET